MSDGYEALLNATIDHLGILQARGQRFVPASPELLKALRGAELPAKGPSTRAGAPAHPRPASPRAEAPAVVQAPVVGEKAVATVVTPQDSREAAMAELQTRALVCVKCPPLASSRSSVVFGKGNLHAELMFVGDAPGAEEDRQGEPFVGPAGQLLNRVITAMNLNAGSTYLANALKCRPHSPGPGSSLRAPTPAELKTCQPYLLAQIEIIRPRVIVALGDAALAGLGLSAQARGEWLTVREIPVMPTFHPSFLIQQDSMANKRLLWEDMLQVLEKLGKPISARQRAYFT